MQHLHLIYGNNVDLMANMNKSLLFATFRTKMKQKGTGGLKTKLDHNLITPN
jgi:hypothetical protein